MLTLFTRYFFICLCSIYSYYIFIKKDTNLKVALSFSTITSTIIAFFIMLFSQFNSLFHITLAFILCYILVTILTHTPKYFSFYVLIISYGLSYVFLTLSSASISILCFYLYKFAHIVPYSKIHLPMGILQFILSFIILRSKRFQRGISLLAKNNFFHIGSALSIILAFNISLAPQYGSTTSIIHIIVLVSASLLTPFLLFYWRHRITQTYREKLRQANEKSMLDEINEHKLTIEKLKADNKHLASIVHTDNKLVPAMLTAVTSHLENYDHLSMEELTTRGREMSEQLHSMVKDRQGILDSQHNETAALPKSGLHTVDGMLSFMKARAEENHIAYKVTFADTIKGTALNALSEEDLLRLLGDLIDNAIIAVNHSEKEKAILIHLGILQDKFLVEISDSGIPFSIETYQRFGNEQYTTHKDSGGSGIGLMDIWKIKKKYKASLHIYEFPEEHGNYTKKISFVFDRKNHFLLQTNRYKEITRELTRGDLYVFPYQSE